MEKNIWRLIDINEIIEETIDWIMKHGCRNVLITCPLDVIDFCETFQSIFDDEIATKAPHAAY